MWAFTNHYLTFFFELHRLLFHLCSTDRPSFSNVKFAHARCIWRKQWRHQTRGTWSCGARIRYVYWICNPLDTTDDIKCHSVSIHKINLFIQKVTAQPKPLRVASAQNVITFLIYEECIQPRPISRYSKIACVRLKTVLCRCLYTDMYVYNSFLSVWMNGQNSLYRDHAELLSTM